MADSEQVKTLVVSPCVCSATEVYLLLPETFFMLHYLTHVGNYQDRSFGKCYAWITWNYGT